MADEQGGHEPDGVGETDYLDPTRPIEAGEPGGVDATRPMSQVPPPLPLTPPGPQPFAPATSQQPPPGPGSWGPPQQGYPGAEGNRGQPGYPQGAGGGYPQSNQPGQPGQQGWSQPGNPQGWDQPGQQGSGQPGQQGWGQPGAHQWGAPGPGRQGQQGQPLGQPGPWGARQGAGAYGASGQAPWGQQGYPVATAPQGSGGSPPTKVRQVMSAKTLGLIVGAIVVLAALGLLAWFTIFQPSATATCDNQTAQCELTLIHSSATVTLTTAKGEKVIRSQGVEGDTARYSVDGTEQSCRRGDTARVGDLSLTCSKVEGDTLVLTVKN